MPAGPKNRKKTGKNRQNARLRRLKNMPIPVILSYNETMKILERK